MNNEEKRRFDEEMERLNKIDPSKLSIDEALDMLQEGIDGERRVLREQLATDRLRDAEAEHKRKKRKRR